MIPIDRYTYISAPLAAALRALGDGIEPVATAALYAPLQAREPYAGVTVQRDLAYGNDPRHCLDLFLPANDDRPRPLLLFVHGGGFVRGDKRSGDSPFYDNVALWALRHGCHAANMTYRLAPTHPWPAAQHDLAAALTWLQAHHPAPVILMGHSAGTVHIAQYLAHPALRRADDGVRAAVLLSGIYDLCTGVYDVQTANTAAVRAYFGDDPAQYPARSALPGLTTCGVPLCIAYAAHDPADFQQQALLLAEACALPAYRLMEHTHMSEIYAVNADEALTAPFSRFIGVHSA